MLRYGEGFGSVELIHGCLEIVDDIQALHAESYGQLNETVSDCEHFLIIIEKIFRYYSMPGSREPEHEKLEQKQEWFVMIS